MEERLTKAQVKEQRHHDRQEWEQKLASEQKKKGLTKGLLWVGGIVFLALCVWGLIALVNAPTPDTTITAITPITNNDMQTGPKNAKVTLVEYADFQCPACGAYFPLVKQLHTDFNGKVRFVYRFFPLTSLHKNAFVAAQVAYAASLQGKFWDMHDLLYGNQKDWAESDNPMITFNQYAQKLGLNMTKFAVDLQSDATKKVITDSINEADNDGINATPTFFINGKQIQNPQSYAAFKQLIQDALK